MQIGTELIFDLATEQILLLRSLLQQLDIFIEPIQNSLSFFLKLPLKLLLQLLNSLRQVILSEFRGLLILLSIEWHPRHELHHRFRKGLALDVIGAQGVDRFEHLAVGSGFEIDLLEHFYVYGLDAVFDAGQALQHLLLEVGVLFHEVRLTGVD
jgi:hypothetical protein